MLSKNMVVGGGVFLNLPLWDEWSNRQAFGIDNNVVEMKGAPHGPAYPTLFLEEFDVGIETWREIGRSEKAVIDGEMDEGNVVGMMESFQNIRICLTR